MKNNNISRYYTHVTHRSIYILYILYKNVRVVSVRAYGMDDDYTTFVHEQPTPRRKKKVEMYFILCLFNNVYTHSHGIYTHM